MTASISDAHGASDRRGHDDPSLRAPSASNNADGSPQTTGFAQQRRRGRRQRDDRNRHVATSHGATASATKASCRSGRPRVAARFRVRPNPSATAATGDATGCPGHAGTLRRYRTRAACRRARPALGDVRASGGDPPGSFGRSHSGRRSTGEDREPAGSKAEASRTHPPKRRPRRRRPRACIWANAVVSPKALATRSGLSDRRHSDHAARGVSEMEAIVSVKRRSALSQQQPRHSRGRCFDEKSRSAPSSIVAIEPPQSRHCTDERRDLPASPRISL